MSGPFRKKLLAVDHWLWRVTWHDGWAWSVSKLGEGSDPRRGMLYRSRDGLNWEFVTEFRLPDNTWNASETTLRFMPDGEMFALTRPHWIGTSKPPYESWSWTKLKQNIVGPNFIRLPDGSLWGAGRRYGEDPTTVLARMTRDSYEPVLTLPSGGDCSYLGMVWHDGMLWMSYYSSHKGKTSIYLAKISIVEEHAGARPVGNHGSATHRPADGNGIVDQSASKSERIRVDAPVATVRQRVHPVLIRNEHNPLMKVVIETDRTDDRVPSFTFTLAGTDDTNDIESLELFRTADPAEFSTADRFGEPMKPTQPLVFRGNHTLQPGKTAFWLSCRLRPRADLAHKVDAVCAAVETSAGMLTPHDESPDVRKRIGIALRKHNDDGVHSYRIPCAGDYAGWDAVVRV